MQAPVGDHRGAPQAPPGSWEHQQLLHARPGAMVAAFVITVVTAGGGHAVVAPDDGSGDGGDVAADVAGDELARVAAGDAVVAADDLGMAADRLDVADQRCAGVEVEGGSSPR